MRNLIDIIESIESEMRDPEKRRARLKAEIEAGMAPIVHNVSSTIEPVYTLGDVEALGWMDKEYHTERIGPDDYETYWTRYYHHDAPGPIRVYTHGAKELELWEPGHQEEI